MYAAAPGHAVQAAPSSRHSNDAPGSEAASAKEASREASTEPSAGPPTIDVSGADASARVP